MGSPPLGGPLLGQAGLERHAEGAALVPQAGAGESDAVSLRHGGGVQTDPLPLGRAMNGEETLMDCRPVAARPDCAALFLRCGSPAFRLVAREPRA